MSIYIIFPFNIAFPIYKNADESIQGKTLENGLCKKIVDIDNTIIKIIIIINSLLKMLLIFVLSNILFFINSTFPQTF